MSTPQAVDSIVELHEMGLATRRAAERALALMAAGASKKAALAAEGISARSLGRYLEADAVARTRADSDADATAALGGAPPVLPLFPAVSEDQHRQLERRVRILELRIHVAGEQLASPFNPNDPRLG